MAKILNWTRNLFRWTASLLPGGDDLSWLTLAKGVTLANLLEGLDSSFQVQTRVVPDIRQGRIKAGSAGLMRPDIWQSITGLSGNIWSVVRLAMSLFLGSALD